MPELRIKILGNKELQTRMKGMADKLIPALRRGILKGIIEIQGEIVRNLSGKVLQVRTDYLRPSWAQPSSISFDVRSKDVVGILGSTVAYAAIHEHGGMAGRNRSVRIPKRPYANPALKKKRRRVLSLIDNEIEKLIRK